MCSNIPASPAYDVYISQLIRYARVSSNYSDFLKRHLHLRNRLLDQAWISRKKIKSVLKFLLRFKEISQLRFFKNFISRNKLRKNSTEFEFENNSYVRKGPTWKPP